MSPAIILSHSLALALEVIAVIVAIRAGRQVIADTPWGWALGLLFAAALILLWGRFAAPNSALRLQLPWLLVFKAAVFGLATVLLFAQSGLLQAAIFGMAVLVHLALALAYSVL